MSIAARCECGKSPIYCIGGVGCKWENGVPIYTSDDVKKMKEGFLLTLKVLREMMAAAKIESGVAKCDELIKQYN